MTLSPFFVQKTQSLFHLWEMMSKHRMRGDRKKGDRGLYKEIVVAVDFSPSCENAFKKAIDIAIAYDAKLIIAHIVDMNFALRYWANNAQLKGTLKNDMKKKTEQYRVRAKKAGVKAEVFVDVGESARTLCRELVNKRKVDLVICGANQKNVIQRFYLGSVSTGILHRAKCDVLVIR